MCDRWTDGRTGRRTDGRTHPLIDMRERIRKKRVESEKNLFSMSLAETALKSRNGFLKLHETVSRADLRKIFPAGALLRPAGALLGKARNRAKLKEYFLGRKAGTSNELKTASKNASKQASSSEQANKRTQTISRQHAFKQASKRASEQAQASKQASKRASEQASKQAT